ncbi:MAG: IS200/IS605 family transposase [Bacteroidetes bacterium]|nr:IS200/IS605 family transposase [Bacteroidota bacterium]MCB0854058.1 IS200/IS605 family transposase [Bacteroidota bacterium]
MATYRRSSHTVTRLTVHIVWATKYRYHVLTGEVQQRCRTLLIQDCESMDISILKGVVSKDHVHMHIEYPAKLSVSEILKQLKGRSSSMLQKEFPHLHNRYWGQRFWARGFGAWSTGNITDEMVQEYLEHHRKPGDRSGDNFILE